MKYINIIILLLLPGMLKAHQDQYFTSEFNNITVRIKTARECEEIIKSKFIGEYCSVLADELNYDEKILIDLIHDYGNSMETASFISFNNGEYKVVWDDEISTVNFRIKRKKKKNRLVIRQIKNSFNISDILKQLEYAIINLSYVKSNSSPIDHKGYGENMKYIIETIPKENIIKIYNIDASLLVQNVLSKRIYRPGTEDYYQLSYFTQNGKYFICDNHPTKIEIIDSLNNIYSFNRVRGSIASVLFVFTSPKEFYCVHEKYLKNKNHITKKQTILTVNDHYYQGIEVNILSKGVFIITHNRFGIDNIAVFYIENEKLISDFNVILDKLKKEN